MWDDSNFVSPNQFLCSGKYIDGYGLLYPYPHLSSSEFSPVVSPPCEEAYPTHITADIGQNQSSHPSVQGDRKMDLPCILPQTLPWDTMTPNALPLDLGSPSSPDTPSAGYSSSSTTSEEESPNDILPEADSEWTRLVDFFNNYSIVVSNHSGTSSYFDRYLESLNTFDQINDRSATRMESTNGTNGIGTQKAGSSLVSSTDVANNSPFKP